MENHDTKITQRIEFIGACTPIYANKNVDDAHTILPFKSPFGNVWESIALTRSRFIQQGPLQIDSWVLLHWNMDNTKWRRYCPSNEWFKAKLTKIISHCNKSIDCQAFRINARATSNGIANAMRANVLYWMPSVRRFLSQNVIYSNKAVCCDERIENQRWKKERVRINSYRCRHLTIRHESRMSRKFNDGNSTPLTFSFLIASILFSLLLSISFSRSITFTVSFSYPSNQNCYWSLFGFMSLTKRCQKPKLIWIHMFFLLFSSSNVNQYLLYWVRYTLMAINFITVDSMQKYFGLAW